MSATTFLTTFQDLQNELQSRLNATSVSTLFTPTLIQTQLNNAYVWASRIFRWPQLKDALITSTIAGQVNYDYPSNWQPESVVRLEISPLNPPVFVRKDFDDFLDYTENFPQNTEQIFANYWTQFFIFPTQPTGTNNMSVWGYKQATPLVNTGDLTIFSSVDPMGNEAIVKQALAVCMAIAENKNIGQVESVEAVNILGALFKKIKEDSQNDQRLDHPMFRVPDYFSGTVTTTDIGSFNVTTVQGQGFN